MKGDIELFFVCYIMSEGGLDQFYIEIREDDREPRRQSLGVGEDWQ